jgi:subtilisin family serine protease
MMRSRRMRHECFWLVIVGFGLAGPGPALALDLPIRHPGRDAIAAPAFLGDRLEIQLRPGPARDARRARAEPGVARFAALGVASIDRVAASLGGARFEHEFPGETPPGPGSDEPDFTAFYRVLLPAAADLEDALARFRALPDVASADPIAVLPVSAVPNDSLWSVSSWFYQPSRRDLHAPEAWDVTRGDTSIVVAILDTGVLSYHPDLGGEVAGSSGQMWTNWRERGGTPGVDDDGNGYVDDVAGWDFVNLGSGFGITVGEDWRDEDNDPSDFAGHGTAVAGVVGAITDNTIGVAGTAWNVRLMPLRIGWSSTALPGGEVDMSYAAAAIRYATRNGANVINCSFATLNLSGLYAAAAAAVQAGVAIVSAAGNDFQPHDLADRDDVIAVAASDPTDSIPAFSNTGAFVDLAAPGVNIASTALVHAGSDSIGSRQPFYQGDFTGTSFSAPLVAGGAALLQARRVALGLPPLLPMTLLLRLRETTDDIASRNPSTTGYGTGRLDLARALNDPPTSFARRGGARSVGPPVVFATRSGKSRVAIATFDSKLLMLDGASGDTLWSATLPGRPARQIAAADLGAGRGIGIFLGTANGRLAGYGLDGAPLAGFPVIGPGAFYAMSAGPALGDVDGDGVLDVVCGADDGSVWVWQADGTPFPNFPVSTGSLPLAGPIALAPGIGGPFAQIVAANRDGSVHLLLADGGEPAGWPVALASATAAPVIARLGARPDTVILVPSGTSLRALNVDGGARFAVSPGGTLSQDPALGDLDLDGFDEIVVASSSPNRVAALDSVGAMRADRGFPYALAAAPQGPPVIGDLQTRLQPGILVYAGSTQVALSDSAKLLAAFPKPGGAGATPTLAEIDGDGRTEVIAGTGPESSLYVYDAGAGTWHGGGNAWPTPRGNSARTGSRLYAPPLPAIDDVAPSAIGDLGADSIAVDTTGHVLVRLRWTAPGDDGSTGQAAGYELQSTTQKGAAGDFASGVRTDLPAPGAAGAIERFTLGALAPGTTYYFALRARDPAGNRGASSNVFGLLTPLGPALRRLGAGVAVASRIQPAARPVTLLWRGGRGASGANQQIRLYDLSGRLLRVLPLPADTAGSIQWDGRDQSGRLVPAGMIFARLISGSFHAQARVVLLP